MKEIIRVCIAKNLDLGSYVRVFLKQRTQEPETGIYNGN